MNPIRRVVISMAGNQSSPHVSLPLIKWLESESFTLSLSSGFFGFFAHAGFLKALEEFDLKPSAYTGSSAGAIIAGAAAAGMSACEIEKLVLGVRREDFWDPSPGLGFVRGRKLQKLIETHIGVRFDALKKPLSIAAFDILARKTATFRGGELARVIRASASVPMMFHPVSIEGRLYWDGGIRDKMGLAGMESRSRIFGHYLYDGKIFGRLFDRGPQETVSWRKFFAARDLPRSGPGHLDRGPEIIEAAYRQTREHLLKATIA